MRAFSFFLVFACFAMAGYSAPAHADNLTVSVVYADDADVTHFRDELIPWQAVGEAANPADQTKATELKPAQQMGFLRFPSTYQADWHPAPRKQYIMVLEGALEVEVGDGERRSFSAGSVLLVTDTEGRGHRSQVVSDDGVFLVWVPVP